MQRIMTMLLEAVSDFPHVEPARSYPKRDYEIKIITARQRDGFCLAERPQVSKLGPDALASYARATLKVVSCHPMDSNVNIKERKLFKTTGNPFNQPSKSCHISLLHKSSLALC